MDDRYAEIKVRRNFFPGDARDLAEKGKVQILLTQSLMSEKTKKILKDAGIVAYEGISPEDVNRIRNDLKEKEQK